MSTSENHWILNGKPAMYLEVLSAENGFWVNYENQRFVFKTFSDLRTWLREIDEVRIARYHKEFNKFIQELSGDEK